MNKTKFISFALIIVASSFFLSACGKKKTETTTTTPQKNVQKELTLSESEKPIISLIPRADGHELKLKIDNIPSTITQIEYELIYSASDAGLEMEKGVGDTVKVSSKNIEKDLLLGTSSCTNGCKYKYDNGVTGGTLSLIFYTNDNQSTSYETPFVLKTSSDIKKDSGLSLPSENFSVKASTTSKSDYFVLIKNFPSYYSAFSSGNGKGVVTNISPASVTKKDMANITGDYLISN